MLSKPEGSRKDHGQEWLARCHFLFLYPRRACVLSLQLCLDSLPPYGLWLSRLLCPWDSAGKNTGVDCHFLLQVIFPTQGWNPHLLEPVSPAFQADSLPLSHVGSSLSENTIYVKVWYVKCADFFFLILLDITRSSSKKAPAVDISTSRCMNGLAPLILTKIEHYHLGRGVFFCLFCQSDGISLCYFHVHFLDFWRA